MRIGVLFTGVTVSGGEILRGRDDTASRVSCFLSHRGTGGLEYHLAPYSLPQSGFRLSSFSYPDASRPNFHLCPSRVLRANFGRREEPRHKCAPADFSISTISISDAATPALRPTTRVAQPARQGS
ncbi:hypothetical protein DTW90_32125 [Neorhizobium sp. P12A]|nr:hypothetical protein DTW90_32125 [Neorhizobium sp. P12A]